MSLTQQVTLLLKESLSGVYICFLLTSNKSNYQTSGSHWVSLSIFSASWATGHSPLGHRAIWAHRVLVHSQQHCLWQAADRVQSGHARGSREGLMRYLLFYCYFCRIDTLSPSDLKHVFWLLIVYILTFVSMSVHIYCSYWMFLWPTFKSLVFKCVPE